MLTTIDLPPAAFRHTALSAASIEEVLGAALVGAAEVTAAVTARGDGDVEKDPATRTPDTINASGTTINAHQ
jgi:hypothetical protein